ncbi:hypothetical protein EPN87_04550 [archaeon]|nr:MAG: hypothetical protein EPN87_04550 [archaeon]
MNCPACGSPSLELLECDVCMKVGCVKCVIKKGKQWACSMCKTGTVQEPKQSTSSIFSMFG